MILSSLFIVQGYITALETNSVASGQAAVGNFSDGDELTVLTIQPSDPVAKEKDDGRESMLIALTENNRLVYKNDTHDNYWDVDPDPTHDLTVTYVAADIFKASRCDATEACVRIVIERVNISTGHVERLYSHTNVLPMNEIGNGHSSRWHDVDRINDSHFVVADLFHDRAFIVNTRTGIITWEWNAQSDYALSSGGDYPNDWTHINDVERLPDGRIMVSLRNQDTVAFLDRDRGVVENWSLGENNRHEILFEQHNPDYIPAENGGPATLVADSENNRIIEYQRVNNTWQQTWVWQDLELAWPRDADRLPNGNTLITDSRGGRVLEINEQNEIIWSVNITGGNGPYEAERLGTGDESSGGISAAELGLASRTVSDSSADQSDSALRSIIKFVPSRIRNVIAFLTPAWMSLVDLLVISIIPTTFIIWMVIEYRWSSFILRFRMPIDGKLRSPVSIRRDD